MAQSGTVVLGINVEQVGPRLFDPSGVTNGCANDQGRNSQNGITATTTQTLAGAQATAQLNYGVNDVAVCANASDSVALPDAVAGAFCHFSNSGAQTCKVFSNSTINGTAGATGVNGPGAGKVGIAICSKDGQWKLGITA